MVMDRSIPRVNVNARPNTNTNTFNYERGEEQQRRSAGDFSIWPQHEEPVLTCRMNEKRNNFNLLSKYIQSEFLCVWILQIFHWNKTREIVEKEGTEEDNRKAWQQAKRCDSD